MKKPIKNQPLTKNLSLQDKMRLLNKQKAQAALSWFFTMFKTQLRRAQVQKDAFNLRINGDVFIGGMFCYTYDPKHKATLPWYDTVPLVIPFSMDNKGFTGLNLHYLPPELRAVLLDKLMDLRKRSNSTRAYMQVSWPILKALSQHKLVAPCVHRYLFPHITSNMIRISDTHWETVAMLPLQKFKKKNVLDVWRQTGVY